MRKIILLLILIMMTAIPAHAEWTEPVRITHGTGALNPRAVIVGDTIHVVARGGLKIIYLRSNDNGETWTEPVCPVDSFYRSYMPDITYSDSSLHIVFRGRVETGGDAHLFHLLSNDGGRSIDEIHQISTIPGAFKSPRIIAKSDTLYVNHRAGESALILCRSFNRGQSWHEPIYIENVGSGDFPHSAPLLYSQGILDIVYSMSVAYLPVAIEVYHTRSNNNGTTWSVREMLSEDDLKEGQSPGAAMDDSGNFIATWFDYKYGTACIGVEGDILGRVGFNHGQTLLPETRLTYTQTGRFSYCLILNNVIHVVWEDLSHYYCQYVKIMYAQSIDWGLSWTDPVVISGPEQRNEYAPILLYNINDGDTTFHCIMSAYNSDGNGRDLYYFKGNPDVTGIDDAEKPLPTDYTLIEAYPNPFNSNTTLTLNSPRGGDIEVVIYNIYGQEIKRFQAHGGKEVKIGWDATDAMGNKLTSGIYFARARTSHQSQIIKLIHLK